MRRSFNLGLSTRIIRGDAPYAPAHYKGGNKPGFGIRSDRTDEGNFIIESG
ncbi:MAG: hypothetical protein HC789_23365 [Microcoleus sp. CSU_2_2]|nr:hypothetical protein [Microcoleus sp. CSU_2_2]